MRMKIIPVLCIATPAFLLFNSACGIGSLPKHGPEAAAANMQALNFTVAMVDDSGTPLDDVKVSVTRYTQEADIAWGGTFTKESNDFPWTHSKNFSYVGVGQVAVRVTFEKPGHAKVQNYYANSNGFTMQMGNIFAGHSSGTVLCIDVSKNPPPPVVMRKLAAAK